ncbi:hypothetical protein CVT24_000623 [Panaeolus cyanescens]|uniref:Protein kinase domain-containing protein n=1 Tax=Panaeolus cyanescens TaxID=181874 RepID=A0A409YTA3_9AGAR|nr:hypothetical protein CVT24_000623 [Panaeolus cyanescens]
MAEPNSGGPKKPFSTPTRGNHPVGSKEKAPSTALNASQTHTSGLKEPLTKAKLTPTVKTDLIKMVQCEATDMLTYLHNFCRANGATPDLPKENTEAVERNLATIQVLIENDPEITKLFSKVPKCRPEPNIYGPLARACNYLFYRLSELEVTDLPSFDERNRIVMIPQPESLSTENEKLPDLKPDLVIVPWEVVKGRYRCLEETFAETPFINNNEVHLNMVWRQILCVLEVKPDNPREMNRQIRLSAKNQQQASEGTPPTPKTEGPPAALNTEGQAVASCRQEFKSLPQCALSTFPEGVRVSATLRAEPGPPPQSVANLSVASHGLEQKLSVIPAQKQSEDFSAAVKRRKRSDDTDSAPSAKRPKQDSDEPSNKLEEARAQLANYLTVRSSSSFDITHSIGLLIQGTSVAITWADRQGTIESHAFDYQENLAHFLLLLLIFQRFNAARWGYGTESISRLKVFKGEDESDRRNFNKVEVFWYDESGTRVSLGFSPMATLYHGVTLVGRGTTVMAGVRKTALLENQTKECVVKAYWPEEQRESEIVIMNRVAEIASKDAPHYVNGHVPVMIDSMEPSFPGSSTATIRAFLKLNTVGSRRFRLIAFERLHDLTTLSEEDLIKAFFQIMFCHRALWAHGVYHLDISLKNLMCHPVTKKGVLSDFDLSRLEGSQGATGTENTGTPPFMALDLLTDEAAAGQVRRRYRHDVESFAWVLAYLYHSFILVDGKHEQRSDNPLAPWLIDNATCLFSKYRLAADWMSFHKRRSASLVLAYPSLEILAACVCDFWIDEENRRSRLIRFGQEEPESLDWDNLVTLQKQVKNDLITTTLDDLCPTTASVMTNVTESNQCKATDLIKYLFKISCASANGGELDVCEETLEQIFKKVQDLINVDEQIRRKFSTAALMTEGFESFAQACNYALHCLSTLEVKPLPEFDERTKIVVVIESEADGTESLDSDDTPHSTPTLAIVYWKHNDADNVLGWRHILCPIAAIPGARSSQKDLCVCKGCFEDLSQNALPILRKGNAVSTTGSSTPESSFEPVPGSLLIQTTSLDSGPLSSNAHPRCQGIKRPNDADTSSRLHKRAKLDAKPSAALQEARAQLTNYLALRSSARFDITHTIGLLIQGSRVSITWGDRQGIIESYEFDYLDNLPHFLLLLLLFQRFTAAQWGYGIESILRLKLHVDNSEPNDHQTLEKSEVLWYDQIGTNVSLAFSPMSLLYQGHNAKLVGRATTVMSGVRKTAVLENQTEECVVKAYWPEEKRESEIVITKRVAEIGERESPYYVNGHVPVVLDSMEPSFPGSNTGAIRSFLNLDTDGSRQFRLIAFERLCDITALNEEDLIKAFFQIMFCHRALWAHGVYHLDISLKNLMCHPVTKKGVLADFDLSRLHSQGPPMTENTGTLPFMALDLLTDKAAAGEVQRRYRHDVESFAWVLAYLYHSFILVDGKREPRSDNPLSPWFTDPMTCRSSKYSLMEDWITFREQRSASQVQLAYPSLDILARRVCLFWILEQINRLDLIRSGQEEPPVDWDALIAVHRNVNNDLVNTTLDDLMSHASHQGLESKIRHVLP